MNIKETKFRYAAISLLVAFLLSGNIYYFFTNKQLKESNYKKEYTVRTLSEEKSKLTNDVSHLITEVNEHQGKNKELDRLLAEAKLELAKNTSTIASLTTSERKLSGEVKVLKSIKLRLLSQVESLGLKIASLEQENSLLKNQNNDLKKSLSQLQDKNFDMQKKIDYAAALKTDLIVVETEKQVQGSRYIKVRKSRKADRLAISFDIPENKLTATGTKNFYVVITDPNNAILPVKGTESGTFKSTEDNVMTNYSVMKEVEYRNTKQKVVAFYNTENKQLVKGKYKLQLFCDGTFSGATSFELK